MYDVGFGDAFLLLIPTSHGERRVLIDCGSVATNTKSVSDIVKAIIGDIKDDDGKTKLDVVIASHRHKDHVSGFASPLWDGVHVSEVWMPWTEHPTDKEAKRIRDKQTGLALSLQRSLQLRLGIAGGAADDDVMGHSDVDPAYRMTLNAVPNEKALQTLHFGFSGDPQRRFFPDGKNSRMYRTDVLPGVVVHILGPAKDEDVIRDIDPPQGDSYLRMDTGSLESIQSGSTSPFAPKWTLRPREISINKDWKHLALDGKEQLQSEKITSDPESALAATLDIRLR